MPRVSVHKFGGSSLPDSACRDAVSCLEGLPRDGGLVVVASALRGVTDRLEELIRAALAGGSGVELLSSIWERHRPPEQPGAETFAAIMGAAEAALESLRSRSPGWEAAADIALAAGEKLSALLLADALEKAGIPSKAVFADTFLPTGSDHRAAQPRWEALGTQLPRALEPLLAQGRVPVVTGFIGRAPSGATTTLGRGGSDVSAAAVAVGLGADSVTIWTDVRGIFSADPRRITDARLLLRMHYEEAVALARCGGHVLHPGTIAPLAIRGIPLQVRSTFEPEAPHTRIDEDAPSPSGQVRALAISESPGLCSVHLIGRDVDSTRSVEQRLSRILAESPFGDPETAFLRGPGSLGVAVSAKGADALARLLHAGFHLATPAGR